jgi:Tfp pilus assembly protein PilP
VLLHAVGSFICAVLILNQAPTEAAQSDTLFPVEKWNYKQAGRRDPFVPLLGLDLGGGGKSSHLSVENLTLIGILWGDKGYYALVKDGVNKGYILKKGDRVAGGKVSSINRQAIIFEIMHAGVITKYELILKEKERR